MGVQTDVQVKFIADENAADPDRLVTAARPNTSATMAATTFVGGGGARNVTVTTTGTGDNGKDLYNTGTDVFGNAMTEVITHRICRSRCRSKIIFNC